MGKPISMKAFHPSENLFEISSRNWFSESICFGDNIEEIPIRQVLHDNIIHLLLCSAFFNSVIMPVINHSHDIFLLRQLLHRSNFILIYNHNLGVLEANAWIFLKYFDDRLLIII